MNRTVWCLWEPPGTLPDYLKLCLGTIDRNAGATVRLLTASDVKTLAPDMRPDLAARVKSIAQQADYYRTHLLLAQGGLWLDLDIVVLKPLDFAFDLVEQNDLVARQSIKGHTSNNFLGAPPGSPIIAECIRRQETILRSLNPGQELPWLELGGQTLTKSLAAGKARFLPTETIAPLPSGAAREFLSRFRSPAPLLRGDPATVMLYNAQFPDWLKVASEEQILSSPIMLARLLRIALGISSLSEEHGRLDPIGRPIEQMQWKLKGVLQRLQRLAS